MLTFTYSFVTLLLEQKKARKLLSNIRNQFQRYTCNDKDVDFSYFETALHLLTQFDESHHRRNIELYVIPVVRKSSHEADTLLLELDALTELSARLLQQVREQAKLFQDRSNGSIQKLCGVMERYCDNLLERLEREEKELFPIAQRVISQDGWFQLASQFISHREEIQKNNLLGASRQHNQHAFHEL